MWLLILLSIVLLLPALAGARGLVRPATGMLFAVAFLLTLCAAALVGYQGRRRMQDNRDRLSDTTALVIIAASLKDTDDVTLRGIAAKGGPAGRAAALLLQQRHLPAEPPAT